jgi:hypothetical protein
LPRFWPGERFSRTVPAELAEYYFQYKASDPRVWNLALFLIETLVLLMIMMTYRSTGSKPMRNTTDTLPG